MNYLNYQQCVAEREGKNTCKKQDKTMMKIRAVIMTIIAQVVLANRECASRSGLSDATGTLGTMTLKVVLLLIALSLTSCATFVVSIAVNAMFVWS